MKWIFREEKEADPALIAEMRDKLGLSDFIVKAFINRSIDTFEKARQVFEIDTAPLLPVSLFEGLDAAVARIKKAVEKNEEILIYGDYDVDGVTAIVILHTYLKKWLKYTKVDYYIPHRQDEGYGMNIEALKTLKDMGVKLIVTVDCGISAKKEVDYCAENGIDVVVTDHHVPDPASMPDRAAAIVNPKLSKVYAETELSGAGTAYKLVCALDAEFRTNIGDAFLDFAALGTVADVVPLSYENRAIVRKGLKKLKFPENRGLKALKEVAGLKEGADITTYHVGFMLGPRINAAGRLDHAKKAVELFISGDAAEVERIAQELNNINDERKKLMQKAEAEAVALLEKSFSESDDFVVALYDPEWNAGIVGLVASKILNKYSRPTFIMTKGEDGLVHGSARSVQSVDIYDALKNTHNFLERYGGHKLAAGVTLKESNVEPFRVALNDYIKSTRTIDDFEQVLHIDDRIIGFITMKDLKVLEKLQPWGEGNPRPVFVLEEVEVKDVKVFKGNTMKFYGKHKDKFYNFIIFRHSEEDGERVVPGQYLDIAFTPTINVWNDQESMSFEVKDYK